MREWMNEARYDSEKLPSFAANQKPEAIASAAQLKMPKQLPPANLCCTFCQIEKTVRNSQLPSLHFAIHTYLQCQIHRQDTNIIDLIINGKNIAVITIKRFLFFRCAACKTHLLPHHDRGIRL
jgi:hypothetical protein